MKQKLIFVLTIAMITSIFCCSCKKYLEAKSNNALVVPTTIKDLQGLLDNADQMNLATPSAGDASADDYFLPPSTFNSLTGFDKALYTWTPFDKIYVNDWANCYLVVYNSNLCLDRLALIEKNNDNVSSWNNVRGSALFFRSFAFDNLVTIYAKAYDESTSTTDLGISIRTSSDFNVPSVRANVKETYNQILTDTKEAATLLPNNPLHPMRPSKAAAYGLLARVYLSMRNYDSAFKYANLSLVIKNQLLDYKNTSLVTPPASVPFKPPFSPFNPEIIFYSEMDLEAISHVPGLAKIDTILYSSYDATDIRKTAYFQSNSGWDYKGTYTANTSTMFTGLATDEIYLIRAECYARGINGNSGDKDLALSDLNILLTNRYMSGFIPITASSSAEALTRILSERRKELLMRGVRWMDIKRLNKGGANLILKRILPNGTTITLLPNANYYALPLPSDVINLNGMPQNPQ